MKLPPPNQTNYENAPAGNHVARCVRLCDLGTQTSTFQGKPKRQRKVYVEFELLNERDAEGCRHVVGKRYTLSSSEKSNLRKDLESWRGKRFTDEDFAQGGFELRNILGAAALVSVMHTERDGTTYSDAKTISPLPKGTDAPAAESRLVYLSLDPEDFDHSVYAELTEKLRGIIATSPEYQQLAHGAATTAERSTSKQTGGDEHVDDAPF